MKKQHICIVGAGLCGSLLAIRMAQRGYKVSVFEKRPDMRRKTLDAGRSINLALSDRGLKALRLAGVEDKVKEIIIPMNGRYIHPNEGAGWLSPYSGREGEHINSVSRPGLNEILLDVAEGFDNVSLHFDHACVNAEPQSGFVEFAGKMGQSMTIHADVIFGTDGAGSAVRQSYVRRGPQIRFDFSQSWLDHGYKELEIPAGPNGEWRLEKNALHIWPRQDYMLIALPNLDGSFTVTLFLAFDGTPGFNQLDTDEKIKDFFQTIFPTATKHMPDLVADFHANPTSALGTIKCFPWQVDGKMLLMGDAAHAIVPFYGQGMNCSLEDVFVLDSFIDEHEGDWSKIMTAYQDDRKKDSDAIADLAIDNYFEMRDHVDNPAFKLKREVEMQLEKQYDYSSKYNLVTFNEDIPYSVAMDLGRRQDAYLLDYFKGRDSTGGVDLDALHLELMKLRPS